MKKMTFILAFTFIQTICFGQENDLPKRDAFKLQLTVDSINFYEADIDASPYVLPDNTIQLYPGEEIYVEVELEKKKIKSIKTVKQNLNPDRTMTISFSQQTEGKKHKGMTLEIENPFDKKLKYQANIFLMQYSKWISTNVLPVGDKLSAYEMWPDIIVTITLTGWTLK